MENFTNKISRLELENFTCFAKAEMDFSSGINVFIGENGTGKTHILKLLYSLFQKQGHAEKFIFDKSIPLEHQRIRRFLVNIFELFKISVPSHLPLIRKNPSNIMKISGRFFDSDFNMIIGEEINGTFLHILGKTNFLFIPTHEMLSLYRGFVSAYEKRENSFDGTHYELAKALDLLPLKKQALNGSEILLEEFNREIGIEVYKKDGQFYLKFKDGLEVEAPLAAEGLKKLAQMIYLIQNGSLNKDTILFWDEPETNLNPKYIKIVAQFLQVLAKNGVQIFVATHDYYLSHLLSLNAEYRDQTDAPPIKFFSLFKGENGTEIESADTIAWLKNNAIVEEYAHFYDLESQLFANTMKQPEPA
jgi:predicted ATPase